MLAEKTKETALRATVAIALIALIFSGCEKPERFVKKSYDRPDPNAIPLLAKSQNASTSKGGMTISVAGETITTDDIVSAGRILDYLRPMAAGGDYADFREQSYDIVSYRVSERIKDILLCYVARKNAPSGIDENLDKAVEKEVNRYSAAFESDYVALKSIKEMGFDNWIDFRDYKRKQFLKQSYLSTKIKTDETVSRNDLLQRYNELKTLEDAYFNIDPTQHPEMNRILTALKARYKRADEETYFRLIEIRPAQLDQRQIDASKGESPHQAASRIAKELRSRIDAGEDFAKIAAGFHGPYRNDKDPESYTDGLEPPYDILETILIDAEEGEVVGPVDAEDRVFILKIESRGAAGIVEFEKIQNLFEFQIKLERQLAQYEEVYRKLAVAAAITDKEKFIDACIGTAFTQLRSE